MHSFIFLLKVLTKGGNCVIIDYNREYKIKGKVKYYGLC